MKRLVMLISLVALPAFATDFDARVAEGNRLESTAEGSKYTAAVGPYIGAAMRTCIPPGSESPADLGAFALVADVSPTGVLTNVVVKPRTRVSVCFSEQLAKAQLPAPPRVAVSTYPLTIEMRATP